MSSSDIAYEVQAEQGWTDVTLLEVVLDYVNNQAADDAFEDYLRERAADENEDYEEEEDADDSGASPEAQRVDPAAGG